MADHSEIINLITAVIQLVVVVGTPAVALMTARWATRRSRRGPKT